MKITANQYLNLISCLMLVRENPHVQKYDYVHDLICTIIDTVMYHNGLINKETMISREELIAVIATLNVIGVICDLHRITYLGEAVLPLAQDLLNNFKEEPREDIITQSMGLVMGLSNEKEELKE